MKLVDEIGFDTSFSFIYSPRPGTPAANLQDDTPREVKLAAPATSAGDDRGQRASASAKRWSARCSAFWSKARRARIRTNSPGRTENNRVVNFPAPVASHARLIGQMVDVRIIARVSAFAARRARYEHATPRPTESEPSHVRDDSTDSIALKTAQPHLEFTAPRDDNARLANLCGPLDENLRQIEPALDVTLQRRGHRISIRGRGAKLALARARKLLRQRARAAVGRRRAARARRSAPPGAHAQRQR